MRTPKPCSRCQIPGINQSTLEVRKEPKQTLDTFRCEFSFKWSKDVFFGMNVLHESAGVLHVGDDVDVLRAASKASAKKTQ
ncbi:unnamed protein product [Ectocarpus sp. 12 AP-2014]